MESIVKKISKIKGVGYILIAIAAAVIFLLLPSSKASSDEKSPQSGSGSTVISKDAEDYISALEKKTEALLKQINGVSECKVMIIADCGYVDTYAADQTIQRSFDSAGTNESEQKKYVTVNTGNSASLVKTKESFPKITGIAVICPDSGDSARLAVTETVKALFNLSSNRISVQK